MSRQTEPVPPTSGIRSGRRRARIVPTDEGHGVTTLELFFDLVSVFAITQVTAFMAVDLGWRSVLRGLVLLSLLWFAVVGLTHLAVYVAAADGDAGLRRQVVRAAVPVCASAGLLLGMTVSVALWWAYFDVVAPVAERVLRNRTGADRVRLARDARAAVRAEAAHH